MSGQIETIKGGISARAAGRDGGSWGCREGRGRSWGRGRRNDNARVGLRKM